MSVTGKRRADRDRRRRRRASRSRRSKRLPIDSLWVGGHIASRNPSPEAMIGLARLATLTERVTVGTSILLLPLYPPALVAKQIADLDRATNGRVMLGVGIGGEYPQEFRALQVPIEERGRRTNEMIPLLRRAVDRRGDHPRRPLLPDGRREDPPGTGAAGRPADHRRRPEGARHAARRDARRRLVPVPVLAPPLRRRRSTTVRQTADGGRPRPLGLPLVRVGVPQHQPRRRRRTRGGRAHDGRHLQPGLQADDRQRRGRRDTPTR